MSTHSIILAKKLKNKINENHPTSKRQQTKITKQRLQNANTMPQTQSQNGELKCNDLKPNELMRQTDKPYL